MYVSHLSVADFRSWVRVDLSLEPGVTVLVGPNGQGKTNLLEAVGYLATLGSHRVASDAPLIRQGCEQAIVQAAVVSGGRQLVLEVAIIAGRANRAKMNRAPVPRPRDLLGGLRTVLFAPEDLALVRGDPSERRRFLDDLLVQRAPRFAAVRANYERVVKQRTALLKTAGMARRGGNPEDLRTLEVWDGHLAAQGAELLSARLALADELAPYLARAYARLAPVRGELSARYVSAVATAAGDPDSAEVLDSTVGAPTGEPTARPGQQELESAMLQEMSRLRRSELDRGLTLVGPHRDEWELAINDLPLRGYASHGEGWSAALALRLASYDLLSADGGEPVLILDDVFAELDSGRRAQLAEIATAAEQVLISTAVGSDVPDRLLGRRFAVADGQVTPVEP
jgi:DNA replication and repair protein RecF